MNKEVQSIARNLGNTLSGEPWYGRAVYSLLEEVDPALVYRKPSAGTRSLIELLYHMITWAAFTLHRIENDQEFDVHEAEKLDWREIDPALHTWADGIRELKKLHAAIEKRLLQKEDDWLKETVDFRKYNFRFLLNGLIQHNIYHAGQIAYVKKLLE